MRGRIRKVEGYPICRYLVVSRMLMAGAQKTRQQDGSGGYLRVIGEIAVRLCKLGEGANLAFFMLLPDKCESNFTKSLYSIEQEGKCSAALFCSAIPHPASPTPPLTGPFQFAPQSTTTSFGPTDCCSKKSRSSSRKRRPLPNSLMSCPCSLRAALPAAARSPG